MFLKSVILKTKQRWPALWSQFGNASYVGVQVVVDSINAVLLTIVLSHWLDPSEYGRYYYLLALVGIMSLTLAIGVKPVVLREAARGNSSFLRSAFWYQLKFVPLFIVLLLIATWFFNRELFSVPLIAIAIVAPFTYIFDNYVYYLAGRKEFKYSTILRLVVVVVTTLSTLITIYLTRDPVWGILVNFISLAVIRGLFYGRILRKASSPISTSKDREALSRSNHLSVINILGTARLYLDRIVVGNSLGFSPVAYYGIAYAYGDLLTSGSKVASNITLPVVSNQNNNSTSRLIKRYFWLLVLLFFGGAAVMSLLAQPLIDLVFPDSYRETIMLAQVLPFVLAFKALGTYFGKIVEIAATTATIYKVNLISYGLEIIAVAVLTPFLGLPGLIGGELVAYVVYLVLSARAITQLDWGN